MRLRNPSLAIRHCPRCVARAGVLVELFTSPLPYERLAAPAAPVTGAERGAERPSAA